MSGVQEVFRKSYVKMSKELKPTNEQAKASRAIINCKSKELGYNVSLCHDCSHIERHYNSCRNRHCPSCQAVARETWIDSRKAEVFDASYFHVVFTLPSELNPLIYANQTLLYNLMHKCVSQTLLELSLDKRYLGAAPGIIQVLHTWGQNLNYHPHIHCIVSGAGLTKDKKLLYSRKRFFIPIKVLRNKFRGKFLALLKRLYNENSLSFSQSCNNLQNQKDWDRFINLLYEKDWVPYIKETFNGNGNAIDYLGRYTHKIAISNSRIKEVTDNDVTFFAKDYRTGRRNEITLSHLEFMRRFLMHVLPKGFQKIRYYGFLSNRFKKDNLNLIALILGKKLFCATLKTMKRDELLKTLWNIDVNICPCCGGYNMRHAGRVYPLRL
jgi:hypothetical protein